MLYLAIIGGLYYLPVYAYEHFAKPQLESIQVQYERGISIAESLETANH